MKKPNLFNYAKKELSQDAILIWLTNWAKSEYEDVNKEMHKTGKIFLKSLISKAGKKIIQFDKISVFPQHKGIDVFIELEVDKEKIAIIIEDKVKSSEHSNQLEKYYHKVLGKGFDKEQIIPIYLKTGFQHNFDNVLKKGYHFYSVHDLMNVFEYGKSIGVRNEIFSDFYDYLVQLKTQYQEDEVSFVNFEDKKIKNWNWWNWIGFFDKHSKSLNAKWGIVPNGREKLVALWFGGTTESVFDNEKKIDFHPYIDVKYSGWNHYTFSYRLGLNGNPQNNKKLRDKIIHKLRGKIEEKNIQVTVPRFRKAKETIELLKVININPEMDEIQVFEFLKKMEKALREN